MHVDGDAQVDDQDVAAAILVAGDSRRSGAGCSRFGAMGARLEGECMKWAHAGWHATRSSHLGVTATRPAARTLTSADFDQVLKLQGERYGLDPVKRQGKHVLVQLSCNHASFYPSATNLPCRSRFYPHAVFFVFRGDANKINSATKKNKKHRNFWLCRTQEMYRLQRPLGYRA